MEAVDGDLETAQRELRSLLDDDLEGVRRPDGHQPVAICCLAYAATVTGDRETGEQLRPLFESMRSRLVQAAPALDFARCPSAVIGLLELLAGRLVAAVEELRSAVERADSLALAWGSAWYRADLALALHRSGEGEEARAILAEAEALARRYEVGWAMRSAAETRAEIEGSEGPAHPAAAAAGRTRPIRALASRGGRRALAAVTSDLDDAELEHRFAERRRQRTLMKGLARGFQPASAAGFSGVIAYELEPYAIDPPPDAPWRWAIEVDSHAGRARLLEPAPPDAAVTLHFGLADWVRVLAGVQNPLVVMASGRCSVEGDVLVAARLEAMFGAR